MIRKLVSSNGREFLSGPAVVNIQLDSYCPLSCPFCFMNLGERKIIDITMLRKYLYELSKMGCHSLVYGQGEPMIYSNIYEAVKIASDYGFRVRISTSGAGCTYNKLKRLKDLGLNELHISLNSYDKIVNSRSRDGYDLALTTIKMAHEAKLNFMINYVAQEDSIPYFEDLLIKAENAGASGVSVLREKVNANGLIKGYTKDSLNKLANIIKKSQIKIEIQECFCELNILVQLGVIQAGLKI